MKNTKAKEDLFLENEYFLEIGGTRVVLTLDLAKELYEKCKKYEAFGFWPREKKEKAALTRARLKMEDSLAKKYLNRK